MRMQRFLSAILFATAFIAVSPGCSRFLSATGRCAHVRIIVPFPAGIGNDIAARLYAEGLSRRWTRPVTVENNPGDDAIAGGGAFAECARRPHAALRHRLDDHGQSACCGACFPTTRFWTWRRSAQAQAPILCHRRHAIVCLRNRLRISSCLRGRSPANCPGAPSRACRTSSLPPRSSVISSAMMQVPTETRRRQQADLGEGRVHVLSQIPAGDGRPGRCGQGAHPRRHQARSASRCCRMCRRSPRPASRRWRSRGCRACSAGAACRPKCATASPPTCAPSPAIPFCMLRFEASGQRVLTGTPAEFAAAIGRQRIRIQQIMHIVDLKNAMK